MVSVMRNVIVSKTHIVTGVGTQKKSSIKIIKCPIIAVYVPSLKIRPKS